MDTMTTEAYCKFPVTVRVWMHHKCYALWTFYNLFTYVYIWWWRWWWWWWWWWENHTHCEQDCNGTKNQFYSCHTTTLMHLSITIFYCMSDLHFNTLYICLCSVKEQSSVCLWGHGSANFQLPIRFCPTHIPILVFSSNATTTVDREILY